jgi:hypothetical protein
MEKKEKRRYSKITEKIDTIENKICEIRDSLSGLKNTFSKKTPPDNLDDDPEDLDPDMCFDPDPEDLDPEICHDEVEADMAAYEAIRDICLESMLDIEPIGEA